MLNKFKEYPDITKYSLLIFVIGLLLALLVILQGYQPRRPTLPPQEQCIDGNITAHIVVGCAYGCDPIYFNNDAETGDIIDCNGTPKFAKSCNIYRDYNVFYRLCGKDLNIISITQNVPDDNTLIQECIALVRRLKRDAGR